MKETILILCNQGGLSGKHMFSFQYFILMLNYES